MIRLPLNNFIKVYNDLANQTWQRMVNLVGVHTVIILVQRALWMTQQKYGEASRIELDETGISFNRLETASPDITKTLVEEFFGSLISILTRLVGRDIARKLAEEIDALISAEEGV